MCQNYKQPRTIGVRELIKCATVESLTQFKTRLTTQCQKSGTFPKGESYLSRKPNRTNELSSLEERLANDICDLMNFIDTGIITSHLKAMFKSDLCASTPGTSTQLELEQFIHDSFHSMNKDEASKPDDSKFNISMSTTSSTVDGCNYRGSDRHNDFVKMETALKLFREKVETEIKILHNQLSTKDNIIEKYEQELCKLREDNLNIKSRLSAMENRFPTIMHSESICKVQSGPVDHDGDPKVLPGSNSTADKPTPLINKLTASSDGATKVRPYDIQQVEEYRKKHSKRVVSQLGNKKQAARRYAFPKQQVKYTCSSRQKPSTRIPYLMNIQTYTLDDETERCIALELNAELGMCHIINATTPTLKAVTLFFENIVRKTNW